jgi:hypothetical protein
MDVRSRVLAVLNGQKPDVVPWLGDLDYWMQWLRVADLMPEQYQGNGMYQYHRDLGVGFYLQGAFPFKFIYDCEVIEEQVGLGKRTTVRTPYGNLTEFQEWYADSFCIGWSERFIKSWRDLKAMRYFYAHTHFEPDFEPVQRRYDLVGDNGLVLMYLPRSPFQHMVAIDAGITTVTYALAAPRGVRGDVRHAEEHLGQGLRNCGQFSAECLMIPENLSSESVDRSSSSVGCSRSIPIDRALAAPENSPSSILTARCAHDPGMLAERV